MITDVPIRSDVPIRFDPELQTVIVVSRQLADKYRDWTPLTAPAQYDHIEAKVVDTNDPNVLDLQARYV